MQNIQNYIIKKKPQKKTKQTAIKGQDVNKASARVHHINHLNLELAEP